MEVFHGSFTKVDKPDLSFSRKTLDFGTGFYVTPVREQAVSWAMRWLCRNRPAIVNRYVFHDELLPELGVRVKDFPVYDREWLRFVADNRAGIQQDQYYVIRGGIANDKVFNTLELFFAKLISEDEALARLKFEKPNHQICIRRQDLIDRLLVFESAEEIPDGSR
ncbi:MAG: DUF3990 domain-containing protein [Clostridia bacterium]|nr:DUF3990 domain-containing protein [Clostridia bacterium]